MNIINIKGQKEIVEYFDKEQNIKILGTVSNSKSITQMFIIFCVINNIIAVMSKIKYTFNLKLINRYHFILIILYLSNIFFVIIIFY